MKEKTKLNLQLNQFLRNRWSQEGGYREVLKIAFPIIISTGSWGIQLFVDRMFLTWYSPHALAASVPAGMLNFTLMGLFIGTANYVSTFVAQYYGAGMKNRIGPSIWQGLYLALLAGIALIPFIILADRIFDLVGHEPTVSRMEAEYFRILCFGAAPVVAAASISGFFSGRGKTWALMWISLSANSVNIVLDYALIFGNWGFPRWGIQGAGTATLISNCVAAVISLLILMRPSFRKEFATLGGWRFDQDLFRRLMRYGLPNGFQYMLELVGFTTFIFLIGRLGTLHLAASNIAFNINTLAFMPMLGFGIAISVMVGQRLGENRPEVAVYSTWSAFHLTFVYMGIVSVCYVLFPKVFLLPFSFGANPDEFAQLSRMVVVLLRFVALYSIFDTMNIVFASAIRGAGDTRFVLVASVFFSWGIMVIPSIIAIVFFNLGLYSLWGFATAYVSLLGIVFLKRFLGGKWKHMRVIEGVKSSDGVA